MLGNLFGVFLTWYPYLWLALAALGLVAAFFLAPALRNRLGPLLTFSVAVFVVLLVFQHFQRYKILETTNAQLQVDLEDRTNRLTTLEKSVSDYQVDLRRLERRQANIRTEVKEATVGLDSKTITEEVQDDPAKATTDLNDRWDKLERMFSDETGRLTGDAASAAPGPSPDKG